MTLIYPGKQRNAGLDHSSGVAIRRLVACLFLFVTLCAGAWAAPSGAEIYDEVVATKGIYDDPALGAYIEELGRRIVAVSEMAGEDFTFTLLDSPDLNAFATAGNYVYVNRGLLNYVSNEAELVSVLAHEIGHVARGHTEGMQGPAVGAQILSAIAAVLSGSNEVYEAGMAYANSLIRGYGRENELEADEAGAEYMAALGYDPREMISMLSIMKDVESLQKKRARERGVPRQTYHGIFSTHPRNDARLRVVVSHSASETGAPSRGSGAARYRELTEGLVWGENFEEKDQPPERYSNMKLRVRFDFPEGWVQERSVPEAEVSGRPENGGARLSMKVMPRTPQEPEEYLYNYLNLPPLKDGTAISPARLKGFTGILPGEDGKPDRRLAVVFYKFKAYVFTGEVDDQEDFDDYDKAFLASVETFRPISSREIEGQKPMTIHWVKATGATTFDRLAETLKLSDSEKEDLRLINGYYPAGEPEPGEWIKIFRR